VYPTGNTGVATVGGFLSTLHIIPPGKKKACGGAHAFFIPACPAALCRSGNRSET
jgi:hypothetical protein